MLPNIDESMNTSISLPISMMACLLNGTINKVYSSKWGGQTWYQYLYTLFSSLVATVVLYIWGDVVNISTYTVLLGGSFGLIVALQGLFMLKALRIGPYSYTIVVTSLSMLMPALSGCLFWGETLTFEQVIGIVLVIACFILSINKEESGRNITVQWLIMCGLTFLCGGSIGILQKIQQTSNY